MATYSYSITTDFGGSIKQEQLHSEIEADGGIAPNLIGVHTTGDNVDIEFDAGLSAGEQTTLNTLVSNHLPDNSKPRINFYSAETRVDGSQGTTYTKLGNFKYPGSNQIGTIDYIDVLAYKDSSVTSYDLRIYDKTNDLVIAEKTGNTNTTIDIIDLGTISNVPTEKAIFEIQGRRTGGNGNNKQFHVDHLVVYHNN